MSVGTRKKFVDFHKILCDDVSQDSFQDNKLHKSFKSKGYKLKKKNSKEKNLLGNKREHTKSLKSDKKRKQNEPGKKLNSKKILRNLIKSKKYPKHPTLKINEKANSKFEDNINSVNFNPKFENEPSQAHNKHSVSNTTSKRKDKAGFKNKKLEKEEFSNLLTQNQEEYLYLGIDINPLKDSLQNGNINTINSDFTSLTQDLFASTKFENSKPFKMIDYILNSDPRYLTSVNDKETYEEIKKTIYNRKTGLSDDSQIVFKSLYPYFKTDFSTSNIYKIFECCNGLIEKFYYPDIDSNNPADSVGGFFFDKKDKFTYQNYLMDKLKNNYNNDWMKEIYDKEMIKSLIYLCNKHMKQSFKVMNGAENNFVNVLKENLKFLEECENEMRQGANLIENVTFKNIKKKLLDNKEISRVLKKKFRRLFSFKKFCNGESLENVDIKRLFIKLLELFTKLKEDEYEKILNKLQKIEKEIEKDKKINSDFLNTEKDFKNVKSFWIKFKIIFYLVTLGNPEIKRYITDESFWRLIIDYVKEKKAIPQQEIPQIDIAMNTKSTRTRKDKKRGDKELINDTPKKQIPIEPASDITIHENPQNNLTSTPNKIFTLNTFEKNSNIKIQKEEEKSFTNNPLDILDNINTPYLNDINAYELVEMEFNKNILTKIANKEKLFEVVKSHETKKIRKRRKANTESNLEKEENLDRSVGEEDVLKENNEEKDEKSEDNKVEVKEEDIEEIVIKPKTVRVKPGFNPKGNITTNNFYNFVNNNSEDTPLTIVKNFSHQFENENVMEIITQNKEGIVEPEIKRKKGRPKKIEIKVQPEENNIQSHND